MPHDRPEKFRKRNTFPMPVFVFAIGLSLAVSACASEKGRKSSMLIRFPKKSFEFGDAIPAEIIFVNTSDSPKTLPQDPRKSIDLQVHAVNRKTGEDLNYLVGKIQVTNAGGMSALTVPVPEEIVIAPKGMLSFSSDLNDRLYLSPGEYECRLTNYSVEESNRARISVHLTPAAYLHLLKTSIDVRQSYDRREWAQDWLKKMQPEIDLRLGLDTDAEAKRHADSAFNEKAYAKYRQWWEENRKASVFLERIRSLNPD
jgi:hypothetical protein